MPQLNPTPWFITLLTLWFMLLMALKPGLLMLTQPTPPTMTPYKQPFRHWDWPWL